MIYNYEVAKKLLYFNRNRDALLAADEMVNKNIFALPPFGKHFIDINNSFKSETNNRSVWRLIHGHTFLGDLFMSYKKTKDIKYIRFSEKLILLWFDYKAIHREDKMIYHDETTALRLSYWLHFNVFCRENLTDKVKNLMDEEIKKTVKLLISDEFHSTNTNHGMFQDIALLSYSLLYNASPFKTDEYKISLARLYNYFNSTFSKDGVHKEHSPDYHFMVSSNVKKIVNAITSLKKGDLTEEEKKLIYIFNNSEKFALHILQPNMHLPKIADCSDTPLNNKPTYANLFESEEFKFVKSLGAEGTKPSEKQVLFKDAGYFISRSSWEKNDTYFLFLASYNANYHKHSDDLSFILYDSSDLFIDSGPNGYEYSSVYTKYGYSGFAHSSLIVNNQSLPRTDQKFDEVGISDSKFDENGYKFSVTGFNYRYDKVKHYRTVEGNHKEKVYTLEDEIVSDERNEYKILFQLSKDVYTEISDNIISIFSLKNDEQRAEIEIQVDKNVKYYNIQTVIGEGLNLRSHEFIKMGSPADAPMIVVTLYNQENIIRVKSKIKLKNFTSKDSLQNKSMRYGLENIEYNFYEVSGKSDKLIILFSEENSKFEDVYINYKNSNHVLAHRLYINNGIRMFTNYHKVNSKSKNYEMDIISLIFNIINKYSIQLDNVTLIGFTKDGFFALYFGLKYGFSNVISLNPQIEMGNYLFSRKECEDISENVLEKIDEGDKLYLNSILKNFYPPQKSYENYYIQLNAMKNQGESFKNYINFLRDRGANIIIKKMQNDIFKKDSSSKSFIFNKLSEIYDKSFYLKYGISDYVVKYKNDQKISIELKILGESFDLVYYLLTRTNEVIYRSNRQTTPILNLSVSNLVNHRLKIFIKYKDMTKKYLSPVIRDINKITLNEIE